jgi:hypothetical protein
MKTLSEMANELVDRKILEDSLDENKPEHMKHIIRLLGEKLYAQKYVSGICCLDDLDPIHGGTEVHMMYTEEEIEEIIRSDPPTFVPDQETRYQAAVKLDKIYRTHEDQEARQMAGKALARYYTQNLSLWQMIKFYFSKQ